MSAATGAFHEHAVHTPTSGSASATFCLHQKPFSHRFGDCTWFEQLGDMNGAGQLLHSEAAARGVLGDALQAQKSHRPRREQHRVHLFDR